MIDLKEDPLIGDDIQIAYDGPGYYSARVNKPTSDGITLVKICEEYIDFKDVKHFAKQNGYKIVPYKLDCCSEVPSHWEVTGCRDIDELEFEDNY